MPTLSARGKKNGDNSSVEPPSDNSPGFGPFNITNQGRINFRGGGGINLPKLLRGAFTAVA